VLCLRSGVNLIFADASYNQHKELCFQKALDALHVVKKKPLFMIFSLNTVTKSLYPFIPI